MPVDPPALPTDVAEAVQGYAQRVEELVAKCAAAQHRDPEAFLWNGRRVLEAACHLALTVKRGNVSRVSSAAGDGSLANLIQELYKAGAIDAQDRTRLTAAREQSNLGVHISKPERENYQKACEDLAHHLPGIIDWLYDESPARHYILRSADLTNALIDIRGEERVSPVTAPIRIALPRDAAPIGSSTPRVLLGLVAAGLALVAGAGAVRLVASGSLVAPDIEVAASAAASTAASTAAPRLALADTTGLAASSQASSAASSTGAPAPPTLPSPASCPPGLTLVPATTLQLGQPEGGRGNWPPATGPILPVDVTAFCVDPGPRTWAQVQAALGPDALQDQTDCRPTEEEARPGQPATCVSQAEAASACAAMVPGGRLPGLAEWEALARSPGAPTATRVEKEWAADPFPAALLRRGQALPGEGMFRQDLEGQAKVQGEMLHSWNRQKTTTRLRRLGFRCAADPLPTGG